MTADLFTYAHNFFLGLYQIGNYTKPLDIIYGEQKAV